MGHIRFTLAIAMLAGCAAEAADLPDRPRWRQSEIALCSDASIEADVLDAAAVWAESGAPKLVYCGRCDASCVGEQDRVDIYANQRGVAVLAGIEWACTGDSGGEQLAVTGPWINGGITGATVWLCGPFRADMDLLTTIAHEFGHALGIEHSDTPGAVMWPGLDPYERRSALTASDVAAVNALYSPFEGIEQ